MWGDLSTTVSVLAFPAASDMIFVSGRPVTGRRQACTRFSDSVGGIAANRVLPVADMVNRRRDLERRVATPSSDLRAKETKRHGQFA